ncbi:MULTISPECIES: dihydrolipoamide acetyltransferase family protein [unclassified Pseudofrankia]|uniref:dihydrolipoamide acetyltransferase family protein n=1 Tax=unclassified Pseudofrankia TaxID=2994372 RepID=UPI0008DA848E|nr:MULTISPECIES: dihydrolipoamide acetyltransferase family protein [unclassified Pseudofrankia]MDT3440232.1 dihydrolipoamide acetyltransferase family protein [Pseudofrankia sp. BMG5.37]OHV58659.1 hypothetical protein BCD48_42355 [Pseudofrankia sp. BMG5.36]
MYDQFHLPDLGEGLAEAEIVHWLVRPGQTVELNQPLVEVETAKAAVEIPSPFEGMVHALHCAEGDLVPVGSALLTVATAEAPAPAGTGAGADDAPPAPVVGHAPVEPAGGEPPRRRPRRPLHQPPAAAAAPGTAADQLLPRPVATASAALSALAPLVRAQPAPALSTAPAANGSAAPARARALATPPVRKLARDLGVDLAAVRPTGPAGTIARADVTAAARLGAPESRPDAGEAPPQRAGDGGAELSSARPGERIPVRGVARQMALAMERSAFTVPQATVHRTVDVTAMLALVARWRAENEAAARPGAAAAPRVTALAFIARAVVAALAAHPMANARWLTSADGSSEIEVFAAVNLGVAVAADRGLIVPIIPDAGSLSLPALAGALAELVAEARAGRTPPARMLGATITVSNVGVFGVDSAAGLVREGEAALVVLGAIRETPAVWEGQVQVRKVMTISVSFDHRILDGEAAARYLGEIAAVLADPPRLLLLG